MQIEGLHTSTELLQTVPAEAPRQHLDPEQLSSSPH